ncbi:acylneuraminate cytidylyltransferase family protein [Salmonirosea aquatica]|uniref:Acylneuraminate cytidylyltransferase family protein n=1 Tax=Salmonirosea aquatica TaxID=2654236 RepID=A0A7C9FQK9_9BACT|nr:acylneuraminate cytidylyltransferase family protein [Cytophagaceae bacterium SJW1-29]
MSNVLAIVPARGGSKGLPGKNTLPLAGHPLIAYSIKAALDSPGITRVIVSTDSTEIADTARQYGAEVPFIRPDEYAQDHSLDIDVFAHALKWLRQHENYTPDLVVQLRPTSPVRYVYDIENCIQKLSERPEADSLRVVTQAFHTPYKMWRLESGQGYLNPLLTLEGTPDPYNQPRQSLPTVYWQIGTLDVIRPRAILEKDSMSGQGILPYIVSQEQAIDIDDLYSFQKAEAYIATHDCVKFQP